MRTLRILAGTLVLLIPLTAQAHTPTELDAWLDDWAQRADGYLSHALLSEWHDMTQRHPVLIPHSAQEPAYDDSDTSARSSASTESGSAQVERWRTLTAIYFGADHVSTALCLMSLESGGNPDAYNSSGASGLMQVLSSWASVYGVSKAALFDPDTNLRIAADLQRRYGWSQWNPYNRGACR